MSPSEPIPAEGVQNNDQLIEYYKEIIEHGVKS
jgi:hypothetical protein